MVDYNFTESGVQEFGDNVIDESFSEIAKVMHEVNDAELVSKEQNLHFKNDYDSIASNITIGNNHIVIPNTADNICSIVSAITECLEQTVEL